MTTTPARDALRNVICAQAASDTDAEAKLDAHAAEVRAASPDDAAELRDELKERKATLGALVERWRGLALDRAATIDRLRAEAAEVLAAALTEAADALAALSPSSAPLLGVHARGEDIAELRRMAAAARPDNTGA